MELAYDTRSRTGIGRAYPQGDAVPAGGWTREDFAPAAGMPVARRGANLRLSASHYMFTTWYATGTNLEFEFSALITDDTTGDILGASSAGYLGLRREVGGGARVMHGTFTDGAAIPGVFLADGQPHRYRFALDAASETYIAYRDDLEVGRTLGSGVSNPTTPTVYFIGRGGAGGTFANCLLWDVSFIDPADDTNSAYFALDARDASGKYPNTHPGSTVADATVVGTVLPVRINSVTAGSGVPVCEGPVVVMQARPTVQSASVSFSIVFDTASEVDPYGWADSVGITLPLGGTLTATLTGRIRATTLAVNPDTASIRLTETGSTGFGQVDHGITLDTVNEWKAFAVTQAAVVTSGTVTRAQVVNFNGANTIEVDDVYLTLTLYPDLS